ncbi:DNA polymerase ligase N-terminal domain-containing protein [Fimbriiglobus ruber]|uniref:DNA ligase D 3'-phosphoesterase domain-containing protein n=1 Tax=Fimbriiglobus ruber TaxID=1908690 RepID=A0A225DZE5_9BACT|nr:DNA polymerase ligase N-terminal domain-containing protein [Fimbriiglobus ruber]OWK43888.1 hypothetical protein FRUB_03487 [Fimbriiglobus ruber]
MPRFALLEHDWPARHWDLLLEDGDVLRAWRLLAEPDPGKTVPAEANADHRLLYLDYEGPVSGNRGSVTCWDGGTYSGTLDTGDGWEVRLSGSRFRGIARLTHAGGGWVVVFS